MNNSTKFKKMAKDNDYQYLGALEGHFRARLDLTGKCYVHVKTPVKFIRSMPLHTVVKFPDGTSRTRVGASFTFLSATLWALNEKKKWLRRLQLK